MTYSVWVKYKELEVEANSPTEAKEIAIEKFRELLDKKELVIMAEEALDSYD
tara:strand:+ start:165 stop:320 length:156 start_codon:yes stop_codon:yes gene_type:complete